ncbi:NAD(+)/NADH kinase [Candidatus Bathyarchaeota archaeon]|jgi:NAD+ kinase|nr:NAD(+)/NADH kinase [Candidatus Bathyarchaeota archaeon]MBT4320221.1 NAD(+)/NADH kinase [Candidatus Bathyarchaeota archaeon]MBT4423390.1 NAD(+)/NADH kinase [Candidatus Bathyarchaeota archaeon]MBT5642617.1 NAD(+)/NADH kinase [Candidatus Bathyarchaeota archaeon]MBT6604530.1 NAD(+)/NADH kinase [Candidatus Bathyarchaeota archaeon]
MRAGIVSRTDTDGSIELTREIIAYLEDQEIEVSVETDTALALELQNHNTNLQDLDGDFIITVGGDGTILKTAMEMKDPKTPLFGVNMGRRGFLAEIQPYEYSEAIQSYLQGEYTIEENLKVRSWGLNMDDAFPDALNELLIACSMPSKMLLTRLSVDNEHITDIQTDGIIFSTPAGSTAYNMSAGGAIVAPGVQGLSLTAICPYSYFKSIVVPPESTVTIELLKPRSNAVAIVDGRHYIPLKPLSIIEATVSENRANFIRFKPFYTRIRRRIFHLRTE